MSGFPIKVDMVEKKGRGVVATKQLSKGNVVFTDSPFVSYVLFENEVCTFVALDLELNMKQDKFTNCSQCMRILSDPAIDKNDLANTFVVCPHCATEACVRIM